ncbi:MAG: DMT family transporter [Burkholderiaceae bacterium]
MSIEAAAPALISAALFGATTPIAKLLGVQIPPLMLAGLLYLGSGVGLAVLIAIRGLRRRGRHVVRLRIPKDEWPWLFGAIATGGVIGPVLLMTGLQTVDGASASLLLNCEGVLTALIAWWVFRENADASIVAGMGLILLGGVLLAWQPGRLALSSGALLIVGACLAWAIDNNLTRKLSSNDAMSIACVKGLAAGLCNATIALAQGVSWPGLSLVATTLAVGFAGYGFSLVLFVIALRTLGTARTGAYFSVAPLFGVVVALLVWPAVPHATFWIAASLMAVGVWLHLRERHTHPHTHEQAEHAHPHVHDMHHRHDHGFDWDDDDGHTHVHSHARLTHAHPHYPDAQHRHTH